MTRKQIDKNISKYQDDIQLIQNEWILSNGRFKQIKLGDFDSLDFVQVHEYKCPNGDIGYQVLIRADEGDDIYHKSINVGAEKERGYDWQPYFQVD